MNGTRADSIDVFFGDANTNEAKVYVELRDHDSEGISLGAMVCGPFRRDSHTLPANAEFIDLGQGQSLLIGAVVVDPCFWTSDEPYYYEVRIELRLAGGSIETVKRMLGIRALGARDTDLFRNSKRWVLRGAQRETIDSEELAEWHDVGAAVVLNDPEEAICLEASLRGVTVVAQLEDLVEEDWIERLRSLSRSPAVAVAILPCDLDGEVLQKQRPRNMLLAQPFESADIDPTITPASWADLAICSGSPESIAMQTRGWEIPVLACRPARTSSDIKKARQECDVLQRDLACHRDFAGYIV